jgi:hypothetical protein
MPIDAKLTAEPPGMVTATMAKIAAITFLAPPVAQQVDTAMEVMLGEFKASRALSTSSMVAYLEEKAGMLGGVMVLAFSADSVRNDKSMSVSNLTATLRDSKSRNIKIVVFGSESDRAVAEAAGAEFVLRTPGLSPSEDIRSYQSGNGINVAKIAIAVTGNSSIAQPGGEAYRDLEFNKSRSMELPSYVIIDTKIAQNKSAELNLANLVRSVMQEKPCVIAVGYDGNEKAFKDMKDLIGRLGLFRVVASIGKALSDIYRALRATSISA